jgi:plasmid stability protein
MAQMLVRDIEESTKERLELRAKANRRSVSAEVREILNNATKDWLGVLSDFRSEHGGIDLELPERMPPRDAGLRG